MDAGRARRRGKEGERRAARRLGGTRTGYLPGQPDVTAGRFAVECKERASLPRWLLAALAQAKAASRGGRTGVLIIHEVHRRDAIVLMALSDFERLARDLESVKAPFADSESPCASGASSA